MLIVKLEGFGTAAAPLWTCRGSVGRVSAGTVADYVCRFGGPTGAVLGEARIDGYPRWSEPVAVLVARAIDETLRKAGPAQDSLEGFRLLVTVSLNETMLIKVPGALLDGALVLAGKSRFETQVSGLGWALARETLCADATGSTALPAFPEPLKIPTYEYEGFGYRRSSDLPPEAQVAFERARAGSTVPAVPGVSDAYFPWDVESFLAGRG